MKNLVARHKCIIRFGSFLTLVFLVSCAGSPNRVHPDYESVRPIQYPESVPSQQHGSIYQPGISNGLFEDFRARQVGDILTVILNESTQAAKASDTSIDKSNSSTIDNPILGGAARTFGGNDYTLGFDLGSDSSFGGESASNQSNSLAGEVTVTVAAVLPNGNLYIQGEKWINLNQGDEYIRLRGIVRPADITSGNTVESARIADARISYSGTGAVAEANVKGWLSRLFSSPLFPF